MTHSFLFATQLLTKSKEIHSLFVTGVCFMKFPSPTSNDDDMMTVLSVSADQTCCVTIAPPLLGKLLGISNWMVLEINSFSTLYQPIGSISFITL